jgi:hypothetical protein
MFAAALVVWLLASAADVYTSNRMNQYGDLREADPLVRNAQGQFDLLRGLVMKVAVTLGLLILTFYWPYVGETLMLVVGGVTMFWAAHNYWLEQHDTTKGKKPLK